MRVPHPATTLAGLCCLVLLSGPAAGAEPECLADTAGQVVNVDESLPAYEFPVLSVFWAALTHSTEGGARNNIQCQFTAKNRGFVQRGLTVYAMGEIFDAEGNSLRELPLKARGFDPVARFSWSLPDYTSVHDVIGIGVGAELVGSREIDFVKLDCGAASIVPCAADRQTVCLRRGRFKVQVDFGAGQRGRVKTSSANFAGFYLSNPSRTDVVVEIFNRCVQNDHFWVGVGSATTVPFEVVVEDSRTGVTRGFSNPLLPPLRSSVMVDPGGFATCP